MRRAFDWTAERDARLVELFTENDLTIAQIAATFGCGPGAVRSRLGKLREKGLVGRKRAPVHDRGKAPAGYV